VSVAALQHPLGHFPTHARSPPRPLPSLARPPGWTFGPDGRCTGVPQSSTPERICGLQASAAAAHPCSERQGLIWVWPAAGPAAAVDAAATKPALVAEVEDAEWMQLSPWMQQDVPISLESLQARGSAALTFCVRAPPLGAGSCDQAAHARPSTSHRCGIAGEFDG